MKKDNLPEYWYMENKYQEVLDFLANKYDQLTIKNWIGQWNYIGKTNCVSHGSCLGTSTIDHFSRYCNEENCIKLTIKQFKQMIKIDEIINNFRYY